MCECNTCYWFSHTVNEPDTCILDPNNLWDIIEDYSVAEECCSYITKKEVDSLVREFLENR